MERPSPLLQTREKGSIPIWDLGGELTGSRAMRLREALLDFFKGGGKELLLNFGKVTSLDALVARILNDAIIWGLNLKGVSLMSNLRCWLSQDIPEGILPLYSQEEKALKSFERYRVESPQEKRTHPRVETNIPVEMRIGGKAYRGVVVNISEGGALVGYMDAIDEDKAFAEGVSLKMELPDQLQFVLVEGGVMKFYPHGEIPAMGVKYTKVEEESKEVIKQIVEG
jgi:anti-anti-sigma regulatory factor